MALSTRTSVLVTATVATRRSTPALVAQSPLFGSQICAWPHPSPAGPLCFALLKPAGSHSLHQFCGFNGGKGRGVNANPSVAPPANHRRRTCPCSGYRRLSGTNGDGSTAGHPKRTSNPWQGQSQVRSALFHVTAQFFLACTKPLGKSEAKSPAAVAGRSPLYAFQVDKIDPRAVGEVHSPVRVGR